MTWLWVLLGIVIWLASLYLLIALVSLAARADEIEERRRARRRRTDLRLVSPPCQPHRVAGRRPPDQAA